MGPVVRLLQAIRSLTKSGAIKTMDDAYRLAQRELGETFSRYQNQIKDAFNQGQKEITKITNKPTADIIPFRKKEGIESLSKGKVKDKGEVIEAVFKPGVDKRGKRVEESPSQASGTSPLMERLEKGIETLKTMKQPGMDLTVGLTRTAVRKILDRSGIQVPDKADPIDFFVQEFGADALMDVKNVAEEMIEIENMGKATKSIDEILEQTGMFNIKRDPNAPKGISNEELEQIKKEVDQEKLLKDFDTTDRTENSMGGINRIGYADGPEDPKNKKGIMKVIKKIPKVGKAVGGLEAAYNALSKKFGSDVLKTADEIPPKEPSELAKAVQGFESRNLKMTDIINDVKKLSPIDAMKEVNEVIAKRGKYKNLSDEQVKKIFDDTQDHIFERDVPADEFAVRFDDEVDIEKGLNDLDEFNVTKDAAQAKKILDDVDEAYGMAPKMAERFELKQKYPGIDDDLLTAIIDDPDPNNKAQVLATLEQLMELQRQGKTPEEAADIIKQTMFKGRRDNSKGGLQYLMGL
jgi:hypothetical protein